MFIRPATVIALTLSLWGCADAGTDAMPRPADPAEGEIDGSEGTALGPDDNRQDAGTEIGACGAPPAAARRYVSHRGDDRLGDGSIERPWRTLLWAIDPASTPFGASGLEVRVASGVYEGALAIERAMAIVADDFDGSSVEQGTEVVVRSAVDGEWVVTIDSGVHVTLRGITVHGRGARNPGIRVSGSGVAIHDVTVLTPRGHGIAIAESPCFEIVDATVTTGGFVLYADVAVDIDDSRGRIAGLEAGDRFDHVVSIAGNRSSVAITGSTLTGSPVHYADGIRVQAAADVTIIGNTIVRPAGADADDGVVHNPPYAGIEVATAGAEGKTVRIAGNTVRGFDVGIGINMIGNQLVVERNLLVDNVSSQVATMWQGGDAPTVDLGGGAASDGDNVLEGGAAAFLHQAPYDVMAGGNDWGGPAAVRIVDGRDDPDAGLVVW
jgi:hypothetical protein